MKPFDMKILVAEFEFRGFIAAVARLTLNGNKITGGEMWNGNGYD